MKDLIRDSLTALAIVVVTIVLVVLIFIVPSRAQSLVVSQSPQVTIVMTTKTVLKFEVKNGAGNAARRDYVGLYVPGGKTYLDWLYLNNTKTKPAKGMKTGIVQFTVAKPGNYEFKVFSLTDNGLTTLRETKPVTVELGPGVESEGVGLIVTRRANNDADQVTIVAEGASGTASVAKDGKISVK